MYMSWKQGTLNLEKTQSKRKSPGYKQPPSTFITREGGTSMILVSPNCCCSGFAVLLFDLYWVWRAIYERGFSPEKHQTVALRNNADVSSFYHCSFKGHQDNLCVHSLRQFYRECDIQSTIDSSFSNAAVIFRSCNLYPRKPMLKRLLSCWKGTGWRIWIRFAEFKNYGPGANTSRRLQWPDYSLMNVSQATNFTMYNFMLGRVWLSG